MRTNLLRCKVILLLTAKSSDFINLVLMLWTVLPMKINKNNFFLHSWFSPHTLSLYPFQDYFVKMPQAHTKCNFVFLCVCPMKTDLLCVHFRLVWRAGEAFKQFFFKSCFHSFENIEGTIKLCCCYFVENNITAYTVRITSMLVITHYCV